LKGGGASGETWSQSKIVFLKALRAGQPLEEYRSEDVRYAGSAKQWRSSPG
jgi:hypothetical protein